MIRLLLISIFYLVVFQFGHSQTDELLLDSIKELTIKASRIDVSSTKLPSSVSSYKSTELQDLKQQISLQEYVRQVPGIFTMNANNMAQDLRISIRGFGSRAAFGIRGIKLIVDGVPETTPDGQGQLDNLNLGIIESIEVLQGPSSTLYGNASGGVISISTFNEIPKNETTAGLTFGSFGLQQYQLSKSLAADKTSAVLYGSYSSSKGYRDQSGFKNLNFDSKIRHRISDKSSIKFNLNYSNSPQADDPGGVNLDVATANRREARDRNLLFKTGEEINQLKSSITFDSEISKSSKISSYAFYATRDFFGKLPFGFGGIIDLSRNYAGHGSTYTTKQANANSINSLQVGYDIAIQKDDRQRFFNVDGDIGDMTFDQRESFFNAAIYVLDHYQIDKIFISGGLRYDYNKLSAEDNFLTNGDSSGYINLSAINPSLGLSYQFNKANHVYASYATSFETPTLNELSNNPDGTEGLNPELKAQQSRNIELGFKGSLIKNRKKDLSYSLALFNISTKNDLVPYELEAFPGRDFFRNAGVTKRKGIEGSMNLTFLNGWSSGLSYTYSDFIFEEYNLPGGNLSGNKLPGIPKSLTNFILSKSGAEGFLFDLNFSLIGELYASDNNDVIVPGYSLLNLNIGYQISTDQLRITPHFGVNNMTNTQYFDNIRINAFGGRYYEAAPEINYFGGVKVRF